MSEPRDPADLLTPADAVVAVVAGLGCTLLGVAALFILPEPYNVVGLVLGIVLVPLVVALLGPPSLLRSGAAGEGWTWHSGHKWPDGLVVYSADSDPMAVTLMDESGDRLELVDCPAEGVYVYENEDHAVTLFLEGP